ncbi:MAG: hypothetical protein WA126_13675 [Thermodesulfovibrionales bacterium]
MFRLTNEEAAALSRSQFVILKRGQNIKNLLLLYRVQDEVDVRKENLINEMEARIKQKTETTELFTIKWKMV